MAQRTSKYAIVLVLLLISTAITIWAHTRPPIVVSSANLASLPLDIGKWHRDAPDVVLGKDVLEGWIVTDKNILLREYADTNGNILSLMLVYKGQDRRGWHLSEMCFSGSGYNVTQSITTVPYAGHNASAVKLVAENTEQGIKTISIYWFARGAVTESNFVRQQAAMALARLNPPKDGWAFIRVTSDVTVSEEETMKQIRDFIKSASTPILRSVTSTD